MNHLREYWEGMSLQGHYTLERWLGGDDSAAFFQTSLAPGGGLAVVKLVPDAVVDGAPLLELWHRALQLRHSNLIELLDWGRAEQDGEIVLYAVFEFPEDTLASALSQSPLNQVESREVLDAVLSALHYLHAEGLVLGALGPDHIVAIGDRIKLSTYNIRAAGTSSDYGNDIRLLGEFWQQTLMLASAKSAQIAAHAADPDPAARWNLDEISAALDPSVPTAPVPAPASDPPVVGHEETPAASSHRRTLEPSAPSSTSKWPFVAATAVILLIFGFNRMRPAYLTPRSPVASASFPAQTHPPTPPKIVEPKLAVPTEPKSSAVEGKEMWRVIAFTYRTREAAAKKVQQLGQHHPGLDAEVFSPDGARGYYLVSLGGRMTRDEAVRLQRSARGKGFPRDLYVQNYSR